MAKNITVKHYKDTGEAEKYYQKRRSVTGFKHIRLLHGNAPALASEIATAFWKKEKVTVLPHLPRSCPMWFLYVSEIEIIPSWAEILVLTGSWICYSSVPYYCAQISVPWRLHEWIYRLKLCISSHGEFFDGMEWAILGLLEIWSLQIEISNSFRTSLVCWNTQFGYPNIVSNFNRVANIQSGLCTFLSQMSYLAHNKIDT